MFFFVFVFFFLGGGGGGGIVDIIVAKLLPIYMYIGVFHQDNKNGKVEKHSRPYFFEGWRYSSIP